MCYLLKIVTHVLSTEDRNMVLAYVCGYLSQITKNSALFFEAVKYFVKLLEYVILNNCEMKNDYNLVEIEVVKESNRETSLCQAYTNIEH